MGGESERGGRFRRRGELRAAVGTGEVAREDDKSGRLPADDDEQ